MYNNDKSVSLSCSIETLSHVFILCKAENDRSRVEELTDSVCAT